MCDICVTQAVKERMLSRRSFFRGAAATAAGVAAGSVFQAPAALAQGHSAVEDLTHELHEASPPSSASSSSSSTRSSPMPKTSSIWRSFG